MVSLSNHGGRAFPRTLRQATHDINISCHCEVRSNRTEKSPSYKVRDCFVPRNDNKLNTEICHFTLRVRGFYNSG